MNREEIIVFANKLSRAGYTVDIELFGRRKPLLTITHDNLAKQTRVFKQSFKRRSHA